MVCTRRYLSYQKLLVRVLLEDLDHVGRLDLLHLLRLPDDLGGLFGYDGTTTLHYTFILPLWPEIVIIDQVHISLGLLDLTTLPSVIRARRVNHARTEQEVRIVVPTSRLNNLESFDLIRVVHDTLRRESLEALVRLEDLLGFTLNAKLGRISQHGWKIDHVGKDTIGLIFLVYPHCDLLLS